MKYKEQLIKKIVTIFEKNRLELSNNQIKGKDILIDLPKKKESIGRDIYFL
jgi:hypothetical protein